MGKPFEGLIITTFDLKNILNVTSEIRKVTASFQKYFTTTQTPRWMESEAKRQARKFCICVCGVLNAMALKFLVV